MKKVLIIEDDPEIVNLLSIHLEDLEFEVSSCLNGAEGYALAKTGDFNLIVLDLMLPGKRGMEVCQDLRRANVNTPIMMLTAQSEEIDKILGLEIGADDYLTKPFNVREFIARVKAIMRRISFQESKTAEADRPKPVDHRGLQIDPDLRKVSFEGKRVDLTPKEFDLLYLLASNPGKSYSRARLLRLVWGYEYDGYEHTVNSHINRLRTKIEPNLNQPQYILTTWGVGYRFSDD